MPADSPDRSASEQFIAANEDYAEPGLLRVRRVLQPSTGPHVQYAGRTCINFCSNDYLGLAADKRISAVFKDNIDRYGTGAGASQYVSGFTAAHADLERMLAEYTGYERALVFSSGYMANLGAITALCNRHTRILADRLAHASLIDAAILSRARLQRYAHNDMSEFTGQLDKTTDRHKLVMTEGVFSMEGDRADLSQLSGLCRSRQALLYLDDAHGFGVLGEKGRGSCDHWHVDTNDVPIMMATFGKALGVGGAFVAGSAALMETILQRARTLIYTTAMPPAQAAAIQEALVITQQEQWRRDKLFELVEYWRSHAGRAGLPLRESDTAIQPLMIGANDRACAVSDALLERGILISAIRPPTVPEGSARLRITLTAAHEKADVDVLITALTEVL